MKSKWKLFLFVGFTFLLAISVIGCGESYTKEDLDAAREAGHNAGFIEGHAAGKTEGYDVGYAEGKDAGVAELSSELTLTQEELSSTQQTLAKTQEELEDVEAELLLSNIKVTNLSISPDYVGSGEEVTISATVTNSGRVPISYPATLRINGSEAETRSVVLKKSVVLNAGESQVVSFTVAEESAGKYTVELGSLSGTFTIAQVIRDLAYITAYGMPYSDDADPEYEGVDISVHCYNSKSETIYFTGVPVKVTVELFWYSNQGIRFLRQVTVYDLWRVLKIPFDAIESRPSGCYRNPILVVVVTTPTQGDFEYSGTEKETGILYWP